jgi:hypothetical protein
VREKADGIRGSSSSSGQVNETLGSQIKVRDSATRNGGGGELSNRASLRLICCITRIVAYISAVSQRSMMQKHVVVRGTKEKRGIER